MIMNTQLTPPNDFWNNFQNSFIETMEQIGYIAEVVGVDSEEAVDLIGA